MTRPQAVIVAILIGFVALAFMAMIVLLLIPYERLFPPTATATSPPPTVTSTPTVPQLLPTASQPTPTLEPTPTNTRVPTVTPRPVESPTPTVDIQLPTPAVKPTATPTQLPTIPSTPTNPPTTGPTPTPIPRQFQISFEADDSTIVQGECTDLEWDVQGAVSVMLDGSPVEPSGEKEVCPDEDSNYRLTVQLPGSAGLQSETVRITVEEEEEEN